MLQGFELSDVTLNDETGISLYIHFPFCESKCCYCDFNSWKPGIGEINRWLTAVEREIFLRLPEGSPIKTIYLGGGTPSLMPINMLKNLASRINQQNDLIHLKEFTVEANPSSFNAEFIRTCLEAGVTRISLGVQSFQDKFLRMLGRVHGGECARASVIAACESPMAVSIDLMFGLPGQDIHHLEQDVLSALSYSVDHVSLYGLCVEKGPPLQQQLRIGALPAIREDFYDCMYNRAASLLQARGFCRYEVSNFAKAGMVSCHNQRYWTHAPYLGLGPGAHSFSMTCRWANPPSLDSYVTWVNSGCDGGFGYLEHLSWQTLYAEAVWLGLRTIQGIDTGRLTTLYGMKPEDKKLTTWVKKGCLEKNGNRYYVKGKGWLFLDTLASDLMP